MRKQDVRRHQRRCGTHPSRAPLQPGQQQQCQGKIIQPMLHIHEIYRLDQSLKLHKSSLGPRQNCNWTSFPRQQQQNTKKISQRERTPPYFACIFPNILRPLLSYVLLTVKYHTALNRGQLETVVIIITDFLFLNESRRDVIGIMD